GRCSRSVPVIERRRQRVGVLQAGVGVGVRPFPGLAGAGRGGHRFLIGWAAARRRRQSRRGRRRSSRGRRFGRRRRRAAGQQQGQRERRETAKHGETSLSGVPRVETPYFQFSGLSYLQYSTNPPGRKELQPGGRKVLQVGNKFLLFLPQHLFEAG